MKISKLILAVIVSVILMTVAYHKSTQSVKASLQAQIESYKDSLEVSRNNELNLKIEVKLNRDTITEERHELKAKAKRIHNFINEVNQLKDSVCKITQDNKDTVVSVIHNNPITVTKYDTIYIHNTYQRKVNDKSISADIVVGSETFHPTIKIHPDYKVWLLQKRVIKIVDENPYCDKDTITITVPK
jgi:cell division protein FtsB